MKNRKGLRVSIEKLYGSKSKNKWFIYKKNIKDDRDYYFHSTGKWETSTQVGGKFTGYFPTKKEAKRFADQFGFKYNN